MAFNLFNFIKALIALIHTFVKFLPLGIYSFTYLSAALFKDKRTAFILLGLLINDTLGFLLKKYFKFEDNENCAIFSSKTEGTALGILPNAHSEVVAFLSAFFFSDMWKNSKIDPIPFTFLIVLLIVTAWSRITIGCKTFKDVVFNVALGGFFGVLYYYLIHKKYQQAKDEQSENKLCGTGFDNYKCNVITDGMVYVKGTNDSEFMNHKNSKNNEKNTAYEGWYDTA